MNFYLLGTLGFGDDERRHAPPKGLPSAVLAMLLLRANRVVAPETLVRSLWTAAPPASAAANLRQYVSRIRHGLDAYAPGESARVRSTAGGYVIDLSRDELDLFRFEDETAEGRRALAAGDPAGARRALERAVRRWSGTLAQGGCPGPEFRTEVHAWSERRLAAHRLLVHARLLLEEYDEAVAELGPLVAGNPFREELWAMLMIALYRSLRRGEALAAFGTARRRFVDDLGIEPTVELQRLHLAMLRGDSVGYAHDWKDRLCRHV